MTFCFDQAYPAGSNKQAGLWNATVNAIKSKNPTLTIYNLGQSQRSGFSFTNFVYSQNPIDVKNITVNYDNIQICVNNSTVVVGKIIDDIIDVKGLINCIQDISSSTTIPPDPADSPTTPPSENGLTMQKLIIIAVLLLVVVLILGGVGIYVVMNSV